LRLAGDRKSHDDHAPHDVSGRKDVKIKNKYSDFSTFHNDLQVAMQRLCFTLANAEMTYCSHQCCQLHRPIRSSS